MPIYQYRCDSCEHVFDHFKIRSDTPPPCHCPECLSEAVDRYLPGQTVSAQFKGSGFYTTDYKGKVPGKRTVTYDEKRHAPKEQKTNIAGTVMSRELLRAKKNISKIKKTKVKVKP